MRKRQKYKRKKKTKQKTTDESYIIRVQTISALQGLSATVLYWLGSLRASRERLDKGRNRVA